MLLSICLFSFSVNGMDRKSNDFGNYLSWSHARQDGDLNKIKDYYSLIDVHKMNNTLSEELFFESVIFEDWNKALEISKLLTKKNKNNFSATLFLFVDDFLKGKTTDQSIKVIDNQYFDINFLKALMLWTNNDSSGKNKNIESVDDCIPLICVHSGLYFMVKNNKQEARNYFEKLYEKNFSSNRVRELLFVNFLELEATEFFTSVYEDLSLNDMNLKKKKIDNFKENRNLLNPVLNKKDGIAELFYNISSWYYQKDLYKYSAFFGKLSLRIRPDFNAMKLLLVSAYEQLGYDELAIDIVTDIDIKNPYFMKFMKIRSSLTDIVKTENQSVINKLTVLAKNFPENWEIKLLLADKLRAQEKYVESIPLYSDVINSNSINDMWVVFYSRGISYERLNNWKAAEQDLKEAMKLEPNDPYVINYLAYSWLDRNINLDKALDLLKKAVKLEPTDGYIMDSLGWAYYLLNSMDKSVYYLEKAVSLLPNDATLNDHLGDAYWKLGRKNEAISQWKRVLVIKPEFKNRKKVIRKISEGI